MQDAKNEAFSMVESEQLESLKTLAEILRNLSYVFQCEEINCRYCPFNNLKSEQSKCGIVLICECAVSVLDNYGSD